MSSAVDIRWVQVKGFENCLPLMVLIPASFLLLTLYVHQPEHASRCMAYKSRGSPKPCQNWTILLRKYTAILRKLHARGALFPGT